MPAPRRKFDNTDLVLPNEEKIRVGTHEDADELTIKLRLPGEWSVEWFARGVKDAKQTTMMLTQKKS